MPHAHFSEAFFLQAGLQASVHVVPGTACERCPEGTVSFCLCPFTRVTSYLLLWFSRT